MTLIQELLTCLRDIADSHCSASLGQVDISHVALRWVLDQPTVASVIVGCRFGVSEHLESNKAHVNLNLNFLKSS